MNTHFCDASCHRRLVQRPDPWPHYRDGVNRRRILGWTRAHPLPVDAVVGAAFVALSVTAALYGPTSTTHRLSPLGAVFALICLVTLTFRRRRPLEVFAVLGAVSGVGLLLDEPVGSTRGPLLLAAWTIGVYRPRLRSFWACGIALAALLILALTADGLDGLRAENLNPLLLILLATAAGTAVRERRANVAALVERADRAERTRESEGARRVAEERLRIARDLHDSLAHHMAVVSVQTGVAQHLLRADPLAAGVALGHARSAAGQVLDELGTVLGVLRSETDSESTEPAPSLTGLASLITPLRASGMDLRCTEVGAPRPLPPAVDQAAYRVVQEALTNAAKHAAGSQIRLTLDFRPDAVRVEVVSGASVIGAGGVASADPGTTGFGLIGMRERCAAVDGRLEAGALPGGGFRVFAVLPTPSAVPAVTQDASS